jgi:hypothetical protein
MALDALGEGPESSREKAWQRVEAMDQWLLSLRRGEPRGERYAAWSAEHLAAAITVATSGFLAVKMLGPFVEEWAKKLGEHLGESTIRALGRIRASRTNDRTTHETAMLEASLPGAFGPTVLVFQHPLSDPAKLAILDLDPADKAVCGQTLYWSETAGAWLSYQDWFTAFRTRHPEFEVEKGGRFVSWADKDGPHTLSSESLTWMMAYLEAQFDR